MNEEPTFASASREQGGKKENEKPLAKMDDSHRAASDSDGEIEYGFFCSYRRFACSLTHRR